MSCWKPDNWLCDPCPSSWGQGGFHNYWLNESNSWIVSEWDRAGDAMVRRCSRGVAKESDLELLCQAARELLLAQSSDWSFILRAGTTTGLARERIERHLKRFWTLMQTMDGLAAPDDSWVQAVQDDDRLFPLVQPRDWQKITDPQS